MKITHYWYRTCKYMVVIDIHDDIHAGYCVLWPSDPTCSHTGQHQHMDKCMYLLVHIHGNPRYNMFSWRK
jgi:hypothetical protein